MAEEAHADERRRAAAEAHRQAERFTQVQADRDAARKDAHMPLPTTEFLERVMR
ncbi:hypothetical protein [Mycetohabitans rhizoxinica]|uniref:Uncharacterized protein n=1 Tax=Mycetohabitans rhizoxinica TaxID=412963 RepID=A0ABZ2PZF4_9BURK